MTMQADAFVTKLFDALTPNDGFLVDALRGAYVKSITRDTDTGEVTVTFQDANSAEGTLQWTPAAGGGGGGTLTVRPPSSTTDSKGIIIRGSDISLDAVMGRIYAAFSDIGSHDAGIADAFVAGIVTSKPANVSILNVGFGSRANPFALGQTVNGAWILVAIRTDQLPNRSHYEVRYTGGTTPTLDQSAWELIGVGTVGDAAHFTLYAYDTKASLNAGNYTVIDLHQIDEALLPIATSTSPGVITPRQLGRVEGSLQQVNVNPMEFDGTGTPASQMTLDKSWLEGFIDNNVEHLLGEEQVNTNITFTVNAGGDADYGGNTNSGTVVFRINNTPYTFRRITYLADDDVVAVKISPDPNAATLAAMGNYRWSLDGGESYLFSSRISTSEISGIREFRFHRKGAQPTAGAHAFRVFDPFNTNKGFPPAPDPLTGTYELTLSSAGRAWRRAHLGGAGSTILINGSGAGLALTDLNRTQATPFTLFSPTFDLDDTGDGDGKIDGEVVFRITGVNIGFVSGGAVVEAHLTDFGFASVVKRGSGLYTAGTTNGEVVGSVNIYNNTVLAGVLTFYLARNAANELGYWYGYQPRSGYSGGGNANVSTPELAFAYTSTSAGGGTTPTLTSVALGADVDINFPATALTWSDWGDIISHTIIAAQTGVVNYDFQTHMSHDATPGGGNRAWANERITRTRGAIVTTLAHDSEYLRSVGAIDAEVYRNISVWDEAEVGDIIKLEGRVAHQLATESDHRIRWDAAGNSLMIAKI